MDSSKRKDDVLVIRGTGVDQNDLLSVLKSAFDRASELAIRYNLVAPLRITLRDAKARCLLTMTMNCDESGWTGRTEPGELDMRGGIAFPWFLVLEDAVGKEIRIRIELDSTSRSM